MEERVNQRESVSISMRRRVRERNRESDRQSNSGMRVRGWGSDKGRKERRAEEGKKGWVDLDGI